MNANPMSYWSSLVVLLLLVACQQCLAGPRKMQECEVDLFRLPTRFKPINYDLRLELNPKIKEIKGVVEILMEVKEKDTMETLTSRSISGIADTYASRNRYIIMHIELIKIERLWFFQNGDTIGSNKILYDNNNKIVVIVLKRQPDLGSALLKIEFWAQVQEEPKGVFLSKLNPDHWTLATHLKPAYARRVFPCFDEPEFKATFDVSIVHPEEVIALSNMPMIENVKYGEGYAKTSFERTPLMPIHLLSLAVGAFHLSWTQLQSGMVITIYAPISLEPAKDMLNSAAMAYDKVTDYFSGIARPSNKIDIVAVDKEPIAVESWGLMALPWGLLSANPQESKPNEWICAVRTMMSHMINQWLGTWITMSWWDDRWLKEGLIAHLTTDLTAQLYPDSELYALVETTFSVMKDDDRKARYITGWRPKKTARQLEASFDLFTYKKSELIVRMFAHFYKEDNFRVAIGELIWLNAVKGLIDAARWWKTLSEKDPQHGRIEIVANQWRKQMGGPTIFLEHMILYGKQGLRVSQRPELASDQVWSVPIQYEFHGGPKNEPVRKGKFVLYGLESWVDLPEWFNIDDANQWLTFNPKFQGYYRVVYLYIEISRMLCRVVKSGQLPAPDQLQLLSDTYFVGKQIGSMTGLGEFVMSLPENIEDGVMLLLTRILAELDSNDWYPELVEMVTQLMKRYCTANGRIRNLAGSDMLNLYARGQVVDFLVNKLECESVIDEVDVIMMNTERMPPFLQDVLDNRQKKEQAQDVYRP